MKNKRSFALSLIFMTVLFACTNSGNQTVQQDTLIKEPELINEPLKTDEDLLLDITKQVLSNLKSKDYQTLDTFIHPSLGLTFSPYGYVDTAKSVTFGKDEFVKKMQQTVAINWGIYDGSGEPIMLNPESYFRKFVYSADFLHADTISVNKIVSKGNVKPNIKEAFPQSAFTESYFAGFDEKYKGMDWQSLILVFKKLNGQYKLVALVHHQWTI